MRCVIRFSMVALTCAAVSASAFGEDKKEEGKKSIKSKSTESTNPVTVDFRSSLKLPFESLTSLGARIQQARDAGDPVGLAAAASELSAAEKASSKKASIMAEQLTKEAVELAKLRDMSAELTAVGHLTGDAGKELASLVGKAKKREAEEAKEAAAAKEGEEKKGIYHELIVDNEAEVAVRIFVNGQFVGFVQAFGHRHFHIHVHGHVTLDARGPHGHSWHEHVHDDYNEYQWTLND